MGIIVKKLDSMGLHVLVEMFNYGIVSVIALGVDWGGLLLFKEVFKFNYIIAASVSFILGLVVNWYSKRAN
jgi:putative flippase GtrA